MHRAWQYLVVMLMLVPMGARADIGALYGQADSLYNLQQYDEARRRYDKRMLDRLARSAAPTKHWPAWL